MNSASPTPILTLKSEVDAVTVAVVRALQAAAKELPFMLVGATARIILLEKVYGLPEGRATRDVDFAVAMDSWDQFREFGDRLVATGYFTRATNAAHRLTFQLPSTNSDQASRIWIDLIPFGEIEDQNKKIFWPPDMAVMMDVGGFADALASALQVEIAKGLIVRVASIPWLALLKLFAWRDRRAENEGKDAVDFAKLITQYGRTGASTRVYEDPAAKQVLEKNNYDPSLAEAWLLGADARRAASNESVTEVVKILGHRKTFERLVDKMAQGSNERTIENVSLLAELFYEGFTAHKTLIQIEPS